MKSLFIRMLLWVLAAISLSACGTLSGTHTADSPDAQLVADVYERLNSDPVAGRYHISVSADQGVVTVSGSVPDEATRLRVKNIVRSAEGFKGVIDNLYAR